MIFPDGTEKLLTEEGYVLEKHLFERWLADEAVAKGAELHAAPPRNGNGANSTVQKINFPIGNLKVGAMNSPLSVRTVIDASGVSGAAAKYLDMGGDVEVIAGFQYEEFLDVPNDGYLDFYLWPKYSPHGLCLDDSKGRRKSKRRTRDHRQEGRHQVPRVLHQRHLPQR